MIINKYDCFYFDSNNNKQYKFMLYSQYCNN